MSARLRPWILLSPALAVIGLLFLGGLALGLSQSFNYMPIIGLNEPSLDAYQKILSSREFSRSFWLTFQIAFFSTVISMLLALSCALVLRETFRGKQFMTFLFQFNLPIPHIVGAIGILFLFSQSGFAARISHQIGLIQESSQFPILVFDPYGIGVMLEYVWKETAFIGVILLAVLQSIGDDYEALAQTLGANRWQRLRYVLLPLIMPGLLSASIFVFAFSFGAFEIPYLLGATFPMVLPVLAFRSYSNVDLNARPEAMAMAMVIAVLSGAMIILYMEFSRRYVRSE